LENFSWLVGDKLIRMVVNLGVSVLVARYLGPEQLGYWNYLLSFTLFFTVFSNLGLESIVPRELVKHPDSVEKILSTVFRLKFLGGLLGFVLSIVVFVWYKGSGVEILLPLSLIASLMIFQSLEVFDYFFKAKLEAKYTIYARNISFAILTLFKLGLVYFDAPLIYFFPINGLEILIGGLMVYIYFKRKGGAFSLSAWDSVTARALLRDSLPMAISGLLVLIYMRIDQVMVTDMVGERANGIYSTGVRLIEVLYFIPIALGESFFPGLVYAREQSKGRYEKNLLSFYGIMTYVGIFFTIAVTLVAIPLMDFLFGEEYLGSGHVLLVYGLTLYSTFVGIAVSKFLMAENFLKIILYRSIFGVLINVGLNLVLIPKYGYMGAAYASLISYYLVAFSLILFKDSRPQLALLLRAWNPRIIIAKIKEKLD